MKDFRNGKELLAIFTTNPNYDNDCATTCVPVELSAKIHFVSVRIVQSLKNGVKEVEVVVFSTNLSDKICEPFYIKDFLANSYGLLDLVHQRVYCQSILKIDPADYNKQNKAIWANKRITKYCPSLTYSDCRLILKLLLDVHEKRAEVNKDSPRHSRSKEFFFDYIDKSLALFTSRVLAIMNECLFWHNLDARQFNSDGEIEKLLELK